MIMVNRNDKKYLACPVSSHYIAQYLPDLQRYISNEERFQELRNHRSARDGNDHHMTIFSAQEYSKISLQEFEAQRHLFSSAWISILGVGKAVSYNRIADFETYYLICESRKLNELRQRLGFAKRDFHITLGFAPEDLHNVSKSKDTKIF